MLNFLCTFSLLVLTNSSVTQLCSTVTPSIVGSSVHGILQAKILEWVAIPSPGDLPHPEIEPVSPALQADSLPSETPGKPSNLIWWLLE